MGGERKTEKVEAEETPEQRLSEENLENRLVTISHFPGEKVEAEEMSEQMLSEENLENRLITISHFPDEKVEAEEMLEQRLSEENLENRLITISHFPGEKVEAKEMSAQMLSEENLENHLVTISQFPGEKVEAEQMLEQRLSEENLESRFITISHYPDRTSRKRPRRKNMRRSISNDHKVVPMRSSSRRRSKRIQNATSVLRKPLCNVLFDHCFRNIWRESPEEQKNPFAHLSCFWFSMYTEKQYRKRVLSWIQKLNIFSKRYVIIPILLWSHWSLLIFCHLGESLESKTKTPCMLLLDSLHSYGAHAKLKPLIRRFVSDIFETEGRPESKRMVRNIPLFVPKVPQQRNDKECGIFVLHYTSLFLERAPECFSVSNGYPYFLNEDWFTEEELEGFYDKLESLGLESSDSEQDLESSDTIEIVQL